MDSRAVAVFVHADAKSGDSVLGSAPVGGDDVDRGARMAAAPDDGHRLNILSSTFTHIGIAVYRDSSGTVWLTQDFSN